ncbi:TRAP transporter substrate-binding protein DctP [Sporobacter termitidis]|nr:TRAP transporter substrate-binding protein DctP [Sporobacter termitidis]
MQTTRVLLLLLAMTLGLLTLSGCNSISPGPSGGSASDAGDVKSTGTQPSSDGRVYTLTVQNHDPATSICGQYVEAWGKVVEDASGGRIKFLYFHGGSLVNADGAVNAVLSDTADICWSAASIYSGQFPISEFIQLPLSGITCARMGCDVMQDMFREIPAFQAEYSSFKIIMLGSCTYAPISTTDKKLETVGDIQGLRIRAPGSTCALWCSSVGMSPLTVATPDTNDMLEKGVIEGCLNDWHNISAGKLYKNFNYIMDFPTPGSPIFMLMNKKKYASLPADLQAVIDRYSGGYASTMAGIYWDSTRAWIYDHAKEYGIEIYQPSNALYTYFTSSAVREKVHTQYVEYLNGFGLDGKAIYDKCMEIVSRYSSKYADPWDKSVSIDDFKG